MNDINDTIGVRSEQRDACRRNTVGVAEAIPECLLVVGGLDGWKRLLYQGSREPLRSSTTHDGTLVEREPIGIDLRHHAEQSFRA